MITGSLSLIGYESHIRTALTHDARNLAVPGLLFEELLVEPSDRIEAKALAEREQLLAYRYPRLT
jgi:hypothetical protein